MSELVCLGFSSSHGGTMTTANGTLKIRGVRACVDQDIHSCPIEGHNQTPVTATGTTKSNKKRLLHVGDVAGCGAVITQGTPGVGT